MTMSHVTEFIGQFDVNIGQRELYHSLRTLSPLLADERILYTVGLAVSHTLPVILLNGFYLLLRVIFGKDALEQYRWQKGKEPPTALVRKCIAYVALFHLLSPLMPWFGFSMAKEYHPTMFDEAEVPGILTMLFQFAVAYFFTDLIFYWAHRLLHEPLPYRWIHKQHHQFYVSIGLAAEYAHPVELLVGNVLPVLFAAIVFKYHFFTMCCWNALALAGTTMGHSGFGPPIAWSDRFHDFHHSQVVCNFGSMPYWDYWMGTDKPWQEYLAKQRKAIKKK